MSMRPSRTVALLATGLALGVATHAQDGSRRSTSPDVPAVTPQPFSIVSLAEVSRVADPQLSPDGHTVVYMLLRADWKANHQTSDLWAQAVGGGAPVQLTKADADERNARWSPDGRTLLFLKAAENGAQLFLMPAAGGEPRQLSRHATSVGAPQWSPDGAAIYFAAVDPVTVEERERQRLRDDIYEFENIKQRHLWKVDVASGAERKITDGDFSVLDYNLSRDGTRLVEQRGPTRLGGDDYLREIWVSDADGGNARQITHNRVEELEPELSPDNATVLFLAEANEKLEPYYDSTLFTVPVSGGAAPRIATRNKELAVDHASWSRDGGAIYGSVNLGMHSQVYRIDAASGEGRPLTTGDHSVQGWSYVPELDRMVFQLDEPTRLGDVYTVAGTGGATTRVTDAFGSLARDHALPRQEKISWKGADGVTVEGLLFYPLDYRPGTRYPVVVQLHGGPKESDKFGYGPGVIVNYVPVLTARGYAVLRPNYRGSTGYGSAFLREVVGDYFRNMPLDVLAGLDALVARGVADPNAFALMGWSAGAHLVNKLITVTDRFKAAASTAGASNWTSMLAETDSREERFNWFGGSPWQPNAPIDRLWGNSPIKDASRVKTPTLLFAGENDARVPLAQAIEMYRALKANNVITKLYVAPREDHQWVGLRHQLFKANAELEWFERYVRNRAYTWERAPGDPADAGIPAR